MFTVSRRATRWIVAGASFAVIATGSVSQAQAPASPSFSLITTDSDVVLRTYGRRVPLDLGVLLAVRNAPFELKVYKTAYDAPMQIEQIDAATGQVIRTLPPETLNEWSGLADFSTVTFTDATGNVAATKSFSFCPNAWDRQRVNDSGPATPTYPSFCASGSPWLKGMVWGIDRDWAVSLFGFDYRPANIRVAPGDYTVRVEISPTYVDLFGIPAEETATELIATVKPPVRRRRHVLHSRRVPARPTQSTSTVPELTNPPAETLPDLVALPAWSVSTEHRRGKDLLAFASTTWNAGPGPLVVEGFRREGEPTMDAFQYFYDQNGEVVGRKSVGELEFDERRGHNHWHFDHFVSYWLLDAETNEIVKSTKQSYCIVPTDGVDLSVPGATWDEYGGSHSSMCGGPRSIWVREALEAGWGDTYFQSVAGQAFNITDLPNGWYYIRVEANEPESLLQSNEDNDIQLRMVHIRGRPGARRAITTPWQGMEI